MERKKNPSCKMHRIPVDETMGRMPDMGNWIMSSGGEDVSIVKMRERLW